MNATLPTLPSTIGMLSDSESEILNERFSSAKTTVANCITCGGRRTFEWFAPNQRTEVVTYDCSCRDQYQLSRWLWHSGIGLRYQRLGWADLTRPDFLGFPVYADYLANAPAYVRVGLGLVVFGPRGTGKTMIGNLVLKDLIGKGFSCYATTFTAMIDSYAKGWKSEEKSLWFDQRLRNSQVLMIDDLGRERNKGGGTVGESMLEEVIRHRVACQMPTIFTTNLNPTEPTSLEAAYGGHTISLLSECSFMCEVDGIDVRQSMLARDGEEAKRGLSRPVVLG